LAGDLRSGFLEWVQKLQRVDGALLQILPSDRFSLACSADLQVRRSGQA
jgi:hypothetical protein